MEKERVKRAMPIGHENAISNWELSAITGFSERAVREYIRQLRVDDGIPIISSADRGYFIPREDNEADIEAGKRFVAMQETQAKNRFLSARAVKNFLFDSREQMTIEGVF